LKSIPSVRVSPMMDSMLSWTELMKLGGTLRLGLAADVEPDGGIESHFFCSTSRWVSSSRKASREGGIGEIAALFTPADDGVHHGGRSTGARRPSRSEVPGLPWKYLLATILVAVLRPVSSELRRFSLFEDRGALFVADQSGCVFSHSTLSKGDTLPSVKKRFQKNQTGGHSGRVHRFRSLNRFCHLVRAFTVAILIPPRNGFP